MALIIVTQQEMSSGGGGSGDGHSHNNLSVLNKLSTDKNSALLFNGSQVGEKALEVAYNLVLTGQQVKQKFIELPYDCDTSRIITLAFQGISMQQDTFWEVIEKDSPEKDLISWGGLELENIAQAGDSISISYYRKVI